MAHAPEQLAPPPDGLSIWCWRNIGPYENNLYLLSDDATGEAYLIDAGWEPEEIARAAQALKVRGILVTHGHKDHHEHVETFRDLLGAPVGIGVHDAEMLSIKPDFLIEDNQTFRFGRHELRALHTPGHTPGSTCLLLNDRLFTGDCLFPGGPGNTRKDPVKFAQIIDSIKARLFVLPDETAVCPGHGRDTTIGAERPHLDEWIARGW